MAKPDFPSLYPAGIHPQTLAQVESTALIPFAEDPRRQLVWQRFLVLYANVTAIVPKCEWWIDGSFLTSKPNPDDVDAAVFIAPSVLNNLSQQNLDVLDALTDRDATKLQYYTDFFIVEEGDPNLRFYWRGVFGFCHDSVSAKGFVSVQHG